MGFRYMSGETIQKGDRILYARGPGIVAFVADREVSDPDTAYFVEEFGGGCMILTEAFGSIFIDDPQDDEDLTFVSRAAP